MEKTVIGKKNPLTSYMRQPKIYITLPSQGQYWPAGSLDMPDNGELPVYSMTAKDELLFKTPDALLNGQAMVDVIQSCIPNIKDAWKTPTLDLDTIMLAIRLATYGEKMTVSAKVPNIPDEESEYEIDLRKLIEQQANNTWINQIAISEDFIIFVNPLTYQHMTKVNLKGFETQRILNMVNDEGLSDEQKLQIFNNSFNNLTQITIDLMSESIYKIVTATEEVTDRKFIMEFINNADKEIFDRVNKHLSVLKTRNELKPIIVTTTPEQREQGAPETFEIPILLNQSDFFA
jgi:hypothetical protein